MGQGYYSHKPATVMSLGPEVILTSIMDHTMKIKRSGSQITITHPFLPLLAEAEL